MAFNDLSFDGIPGLEALQDELERNVSDQERVGSAFLSAVLIPVALKSHGVGRWSLLAAAGALLYRGITGRCPLYNALDVDRRHQRPGVTANRGIRVESSIEIACPTETLFRFWRNLSELPRVLRHVEAVTEIGELSHWKVNGPLGTTLEWDAEIINEHPNQLIAWQSMPGASVDNAGSVRFEHGRGGTTRLKVAFDFTPPAGALGAALGKLFGASPQRFLEEDLAAFKEFAERELANPKTGV